MPELHCLPRASRMWKGILESCCITRMVPPSALRASRRQDWNLPSPATSAGPVVPGVEVKLMGGDGQKVKEGEVGEVWVRGPNVMKGYYRSPEETAESLSADGWFNTRDLARFEDGNLFIAGRTKDMIIRFGFNVYPAEVEAVLNAHPAVARAAVVGRMVRSEEEIVAFVQLHPESSGEH